MLTMMQKRDDLAGWLEDLLQVHDARFIVDTLERRELEIVTDRKSRLSVIGEPVRYATVFDLGTGGVLDGIDGAGNVCDYGAHSFEVRIFWGKSYSPTYTGSTQALFEAAIYNASDAAKPGILATIRENRTRYVSGDPYFIGQPQGDPLQNMRRASWDFGDIGAPEMAHYFTFNLTAY